MKASDLMKEGNPTIFIFGKPGCGKTGLISQIGEGGYIFDFDGKMRTALTLKDKFTPLRMAVEFDTYKDSDPENPSAYVKVLDKLRFFLKNPPRALGIDSLTGLAEVTMRYRLKVAHADAFNIPTLGNKGQAAGDWTQMVNDMEKVLSMFRSVPCLKIASAHDSFMEVPDKGVIHIIQSITRNHGRSKLAWWCDELLFMTCKNMGANDWRYFLNGRSEDMPCRTCSGIVTNFDAGKEGLPGLLKQMQYQYDFKPLVA